MKTTRVWITLVTFLLIGTAVAAETVAGLPLHVKKLDGKTVRVWVGDSISSTATVALATEKGIVVVDTLGIPKVDAELREVIARELGRSDFKVLINTHEHGDHTGGNAVYKDCTIVGHELVAVGMVVPESTRQQRAGWHAQSVAALKAELEKETPGTPAAKRIQEQMLLSDLNWEAFQANTQPTPPTLTFSGRMTFGMGDTTFELYYTGGMHTASDIAIFVPESGLLLTGDTMADVWLTDTPGCLASFAVRQGVRHDFPLLLENWGLLLQKKGQIRQLVTGHWNGDLTLQGFEARVNYVRTLWEGVNQGVKEGKGLDELQAAYRLETRFPELVESPGFNKNLHYQTVTELFSVAAKLESAAARLYELIDEGAPEEAVRQVLAARDAKPPKYFYQENEVTGRGYHFLQQDKVPQAIRMFRAYVALFPESWNAYDSLGEALAKSGDLDGAQKMYEKSVSLKPDSKSGFEALEKIREAKAKTK